MPISHPEHDALLPQHRARPSRERRRPSRAASQLALLGLVAAGLVLQGWVLTAAVEAASGDSAAIPSALMAREQDLESRLLEAAADGALVRLIDGISGDSERRVAERALESLRGSDGGIVADVCITRLADRTRTLLSGDTATPMCGGKAVRSAVAAAPPGAVIQTLPLATDGRRRLLLSTALEGVSDGAASVVAAEVDIEALLADVMPARADVLAAMLVDLDSSTVLATTGELGLVAEGPGDEASSDLEPYVSGILAGGTATTGAAGELGLGATIAPLWTTTDGTRLGLIEVAPMIVPAAVVEGGGIMLPIGVGVVILVVVLVGWSVRRASLRSTASTRVEALYREALDGPSVDPLTGLRQREAFQEELAKAMDRYYDTGLAFALAWLDVDDLRAVNDREGQRAGDEALISVVGALRRVLPSDDQVFRIGGDEFAVLLPGVDAASAATSLERVLHHGRRPDPGVRPSSFSCGISSVPQYSTDPAIVTEQAAAVLSWVKAHGRGAVEVYDPDRDRVPDQPHDIANLAVQEVVSGKLLSPVFQPIVDVQSGRVLGFEGLIRPDPYGPLPSPSHLFAAASATGRTVELDIVCIELVLAGARAIPPDQLLTLNLSPRTLEVKDFDASWLLEGLMRNGISPRRVIVELTERDAIGDLRRLQQTFEHLQSYGLRLAADDVGAGNSGLRLLSQVQFDIVKIDLSLVQDGVHHLGSRTVLESLRDLAFGQQSNVVAEGVETAEQLQVIQDLGIGAAQGYLLGRPDVSVAHTFVDVRQLASGIVVPVGADIRGVADAVDAGAGMVQRPDQQREARLRPAAGTA